MTSDLIPQALVVPSVLLVGQVLLAALLFRQRRLQRRETGLFATFLLLALAWTLTTIQSGLRAAWPTVPWARFAPYLLVGLGAALEGSTQAFLHKPTGWLRGLPAVIAALVTLLFDIGWITVPSFSLAVGPFSLTFEQLVPALALLVAAIYVGVSLLAISIEYVRRRSPLHRNRIKYYTIGTTAAIGGLALAGAVSLLAPAQQSIVEIAGAAIHWLGAALLTHVFVHPQLPDIATGTRRAISYVAATLIPVVLIVGAATGLLYLFHSLALLSYSITEEFVLGAIVAGAAVFLLYQPVSNLTRRIVDRLLFGHSYRSQQVVREYGQAVTQTLSLETLAATALRIIDTALEVTRGTLLVVTETSETGWRLRMIEGSEASRDRPQIVLATDTPLADWLVRQGAPLHQYTLDVDPHFREVSSQDREMWRGLDMEVFFPVRHSGVLIGLLALGLRRSGRPYTGPELELLATLADQTAVALQNAMLFDGARRRADQLALLNEIGRVITSSLDLEPTLDLIVQRIETAFSNAWGYLFLLDDYQGDLVLQKTFGPGIPEADPFRIPIARGLVGRVAQEGAPVRVSDLPEDPRYDADIEGTLSPEARSAMCVPIIARGRTIGVILVTALEQARFGSTELSFLDSIGSFASIAIENVQQVAAREARLQRQVEALRIEIDEIKREKQVKEITDTDHFRQLQAQARELREHRDRAAAPGLFDRLQEEVEKRTSQVEDEDDPTKDEQEIDQ